MINIKDAVNKALERGGLKTSPKGNEIRGKVEDIALSPVSVADIDENLAMVKKVMDSKTNEAVKDAGEEFDASLNTYSVQAVEKKELVPVQEENKMIKFAKNILAKLKQIMGKKELVAEVEDINKESQKESMKKIFIKGVKTALKIALEKAFGIGTIVDILEFSKEVADELKKMFEYQKANKNRNHELAIEH